jgi:hypothetical protein
MAQAMSDIMNEPIIREYCCSYCRQPGHNVKSCHHEDLKKLHDSMLKTAALTLLFPFVGKRVIEFKLSELCTRELNALKSQFIVPNHMRERVKLKRGIIEHLTNAYYHMTQAQATPHLAEIIGLYQFDPEAPEVGPESEVVTDFADIVHMLWPYNAQYFNSIMGWHSQRTLEYYQAAHRSLINSPHRFDILAIVTPIKAQAQAPAPAEAESESEEAFECPICYQDNLGPICGVSMNCKHKYCTNCISNYMESASKQLEYKQPTCGMCRSPIVELEFKDFEKASAFKEKYIKEENVMIFY